MISSISCRLWSLDGGDGRACGWLRFFSLFLSSRQSERCYFVVWNEAETLSEITLCKSVPLFREYLFSVSPAAGHGAVLTIIETQWCSHITHHIKSCLWSCTYVFTSLFIMFWDFPFHRIPLSFLPMSSQAFSFLIAHFCLKDLLAIDFGFFKYLFL